MRNRRLMAEPLTMQRPLPETHDASLSRFQEYNALPDDILHSFSAKGNSSSNLLKDLIETTNNLSNSLSVYSSVEWTSDKLVSLMRQSSSISQALYTVSTQRSSRIERSYLEMLNVPSSLNTKADISSQPSVNVQA